MSLKKINLRQNQAVLFGLVGVVVIVIAAVSIFYLLQSTQVPDNGGGVITPIIITSSAEADSTFDEISVDISGLRSSLEEIDLAFTDTNS